MTNENLVDCEIFVKKIASSNITENINYNRIMKKNRIRLTESQLHRVIKESVIKVLKEEFDTISNDDGMTFYLVNGYATGEKWKAPSVDDAIKRCVKVSEYMATANWLFMCTPNGTQELGRTVRVDYGWGWKFVPKD